ncbi:MAG: TetR family transcriptional regulator C-terminal domain-containing protein [Paracoccaceae bacterium]|nr:MAG: TetR family transcriptional regulator C-terminal domain-containing protein [Paracoccaceae bacterium]
MNEASPKPGAPRSSRAEAKAERRLQLIEAMIDCIAKFGLSGTTMAKVTELAGVSVGLANFHFDSKERLFEAVLQHLADEQRALWQSRLQGPDRSSADLLRAIVESRFHPAICARRKLAVWFAFYGDAGARDIYRRAVGDVDDERLEASAALIAEMIEEAGYVGIDPVETVLTTEAMWDGLWLNMLLYPNEFRRSVCRDRAMRMIAMLFPRHFDIGPATD